MKFTKLELDQIETTIRLLFNNSDLNFDYFRKMPEKFLDSLLFKNYNGKYFIDLILKYEEIFRKYYEERYQIILLYHDLFVYDYEIDKSLLTHYFTEYHNSKERVVDKKCLRKIIHFYLRILKDYGFLKDKRIYLIHPTNDRCYINGNTIRQSWTVRFNDIETGIIYQPFSINLDTKYYSESNEVLNFQLSISSYVLPEDFAYCRRNKFKKMFINGKAFSSDHVLYSYLIEYVFNLYVNDYSHIKEFFNSEEYNLDLSEEEIIKRINERK